MIGNYYGNPSGMPPQNGYYPMNNGAAPDNLAMLRQNQYQQPFPQQYQQNMQPIQQTAQFPIQQNNSTINWVSCEREAMEYPLAPNSAVALWDSNAPVVYLKQADASGKPTTEIYDLVKRQPIGSQQAVQQASIQTADFITRDEFNALEARLDVFINEKSQSKSKSVKEE